MSSSFNSGLASLLNSESTGHHLIGLHWKESSAGVPSDWMCWKASNISTHTLHLKHIKVQTSSDTCTVDAHT